jgi:hypothetical protein
MKIRDQWCLDMPSVCNNVISEHVKQTRKEQQMMLYSAEQDQQMFSSRPSQSRQMPIYKLHNLQMHFCYLLINV